MQVTTVSMVESQNFSEYRHTAASRKYNHLFALDTNGTAGSTFTSWPLMGLSASTPLQEIALLFEAVQVGGAQHPKHRTTSPLDATFLA